MHVLAPLLIHFDRLAYLLSRGDVSRIMDRVAMLLPAIARVLAARRPLEAEDRTIWDRYSDPLCKAIRACEAVVRNMPWPVCRSGLVWRPTWLLPLLDDCTHYFTIEAAGVKFDQLTESPIIPFAPDHVPPPSVN